MVGWFVLLGLVCAMLVAAYTVVLPRFFLKYRYRLAEPSGRGLKIVRNENGVRILCEPEREIRSYIKRYILSQENGKKFLICRLDDQIRSIDYEILLFNGENKIFKSLRVKEKIERAGYTRLVELPAETCCVSLLVNAADGIRFRNNDVRKIEKRLLMVFLALCVLLEALGFWALRACLIQALGGIFTEIIFALKPDLDMFLGVAAAAVLVTLLFTLIAVRIHGNK